MTKLVLQRTAAPPDGYTFMMTSTAYGFLIDKPKVPVDLVNSFAPVVLIGFGDSALLVHPSLPVKTVKDLIALAKKKPGELFYASSDIIARFHGETMDILSLPAFQKRLEEQGGVVVKTSTAEFGKLMVSEQNKWIEVIKAAGIRGE